MTIIEFLESLKFDYLKTYSGLRKGNIEQTKLEKLHEISTLNKNIKRLINEDEREIWAKRVNELKIQIDSNDIQVLKKNVFHKSAKEIDKFERDSKFIFKLKKIAEESSSIKTHWVCAPIFRDAIVFYSKEDKIVKILQICFSCDHLINGNEEQIFAGDEFFIKLKELFKTINHPIDV